MPISHHAFHSVIIRYRDVCGDYELILDILCLDVSLKMCGIYSLILMTELNKALNVIKRIVYGLKYKSIPITIQTRPIHIRY